MTAREYAKKCGVELVGKLTRKTNIKKRYDAYINEFVEVKETYYVDEVGTELWKDNGMWCIVSADGTRVI